MGNRTDIVQGRFKPKTTIKVTALLIFVVEW
jgi:hypothetical protein